MKGEKIRDKIRMFKENDGELATYIKNFKIAKKERKEIIENESDQDPKEKVNDLQQSYFKIQKISMVNFGV